MNIIEMKELFFFLISACKKNFKEFMIVSLMAGFCMICYFYMDLSQSTHVLRNEAVAIQYSKDTAVINFLKMRVTKLEDQVEESNRYVNAVRDGFDNKKNNIKK